MTACSPPFSLPPQSDLSAIGIYNALDYGMTQGSGPGIPGDNKRALQDAVSAAIAAGGGTVLIPTGDYEINGSITVDATDSPPGISIAVTIMGTSGTTTLDVQNNDNLFEVTTSLDGTNAVVFQDLQITYATNNNTSIAISVTQGNVRLLRVVITNAQRGVVFGETTRCGMLHCTIRYTHDGPNGARAVTLGLSESSVARGVYIAFCTFITHAENSPPAPTSGEGIVITAAEDVRVVATRIESFEQGIVIQPLSDGASVIKLYFRNVNVYTNSSGSALGAAVAIQPSTSCTVSDVEFVGCDVGPTADIPTDYAGAGIYIAEGSGSVDQVRLVSCYSCAWNGPGLQIEGASNIEVLGGYYSCNGIEASSPPSGMAGIAIAITGTGTVSGVRIVGAGCTNSVFSLGPDGTWLPSTQDYGVALGNSASDISVRDCDLTGNLLEAVTVAGGAGVAVTDCAGYNDQAKVLPPPPLATTFRNTSLDYHGPVAFYVWGDTPSVTIDGRLTGLGRGGFTLAPGESAFIAVSGPGTTVYAVGQ